ncbi:MAG: hypothetical protein GXP45_02245 [bacterium]|nr:hypothetical protein [bacterium]
MARIFRNEGISPEHAQDYMQMENYRAYSDFRDQMRLIKDMYIYIADKVYKKRKFTIRGHEVDFDAEWKEYDFTETIENMTGINIRKASDEEIIAKLKKLTIAYPDKNRGRMIDYLWKWCRKQIA